MFKKTFFIVVCVFICVFDGITARYLNNTDRHELFELSIIHINDFHARFVQTSTSSNTCHKGKEDQCIGGLGRLMTVTRQLLRERKNPIFLNAGDNYQGSLWYNVFKWNVTAYFMNKLPHDAMAIGNHDFDDGVEGLVHFLKNVRFQVLSTNIDASEEPTIQGLYKNSTIITRGNRTIGIIGVITKTTDYIAKTGKLKFLDEVDSVNAEASRLKAKGIEIIIVLSHVGLEVDRDIAKNCPDVDVIVGGHSHFFLYTGKPPFTDNPIDKYPVVVKQITTNRTVLIVTAGSYNKYVGNLSVWFDQQGEVVDWDGNPIFLSNSIEQDTDMMKDLQRWSEAVDSRVHGDRVIGEILTSLDGQCSTVKQCKLIHLVTDAMVYYYEKKHANSENQTYTAIGCINSGAIRSSLSIGNVTSADLKSVLPFDENWSLVEIKGEDLLLAIEECVTRSDEKSHFRFPGLLYWSGVRVTYNMSMPAWSRVQDLSIRCQSCKQPKYESLELEKWYRMVVYNFLLREGDGLKTIAKKSRNLHEETSDIDTFVEFIEAKSPITYEDDYRMRLVGEWSG